MGDCVRQFKSAFIYLLLVAAVIVFAIGEYIDAGVIIGFVIINAALGFYQEYRSEQSLRTLQQFIKPRTRVKRDSGWHTIDSRNLVAGDIIKLGTGDVVPADVRLISTQNLVVNETVLTGESVPVPKRPDIPAVEPQTIYESHNLCFSGTSVVGGEAVAVVLETGIRTAMGTIAKLTVETTKESEFSKGIGRFSQFILRMILVTLVFVFVANLLLKGDSVDILELVVFSIALVVSVVPEALPVVTTVSLSRGALQLAKQDVVVKRLTAIEDIGSIEVLCSDKTGTLTENILSVTELSPGADPGLLHYAALTVAETEEKTEPFDIAIVEGAARLLIGETPPSERLAELPFDPHTRLNAVLVRTPSGPRDGRSRRSRRRSCASPLTSGPEREGTYNLALHERAGRGTDNRACQTIHAAHCHRHFTRGCTGSRVSRCHCIYRSDQAFRVPCCGKSKRARA